MSKKKNNLIILMLTLFYYCAVGQQIPKQPSTNKGPNLDATKLSYDVPSRGQSPPQFTPAPLGKPSYANVASNQQPKPNIPHQPAPLGGSGPTTKRPSLITNDNELRTFSEELLTKDINNAAKYVSIQLQHQLNKGQLDDKAPKPLLTINSDAYKIPSIDKVRQFYDNYVQDLKQEQTTDAEKRKIESFLDIVLDTEVMKHAFNFLKSKKVVDQDIKKFRDKLRNIWFDHYLHENGKTWSSGFENVFLSESKNDQVTGLHNWIYFSREEVANRANYLGYIRNIDLGQKGAVLKIRFKYNNLQKSPNTLFVGTSPELEMALYTVCYLLRADSQCPVKMNNVKFNIKTYNKNYNNKNYIGRAFPDVA